MPKKVEKKNKVLEEKKVKKQEGMKSMYFTTPIYYVNDAPHIGHIFTTVCADFLKRFYTSLGYDVFFLTGTDEHGQKIANSAEKLGLTPREFTDTIVPKYLETWRKFEITNNHFIRTTDPEHEKMVSDWFQKMYDKGDIYKGTYEGKYCVACEGYYGDDELLPGDICPTHKKPITVMKEESYFFKLSKYEPYIKELFAKKDYIFPEKYKGEAHQRISKGLKDVSVSRKTLDWGIKVPFDNTHVIWVWFDALINYVSGLQENKSYWPATHLIGKDIFWFHCVLWPAMLKSVGYEAPKFFIHGYWNRDGNKMGKSQNNFVTPEILAKYGVDEARYFILRQMAYGEDSDFNAKFFEEKYLELANNVGNLINRIAILCQKNYIDLTKEYAVDKELLNEVSKTIKEVKEDLDCFKIQSGLVKIITFAQFLNKYVNDTEPWKLVKENKEKTSFVLANLVYGINILTLLLTPAMPNKMKEARKIFGFKAEKLTEVFDVEKKKFLSEKVVEIEPKILFPQIMKFEF